MLSNMEDVPEIPPSPQQLSVDLYSLPDVEHLLQDSDTALHLIPGGSLHGGSNFEIPPLPRRVSIQLYPLSDVPAGISQDPSLSVGERRVHERDLPPSPKRVSVNLYSVSDIAQSISDNSDAEGHRDTSPSPSQLHINLYSLQDVGSVLLDTTSIDGAQNATSSEEPLPISHSIDLFPGHQVSPWADSTFDQTPSPTAHEIPLHSTSELPNPVSAIIHPTGISISLSPVEEQTTEEENENQDPAGGLESDEGFSSSLLPTQSRRTNLQNLQHHDGSIDSSGTRRQDGFEDDPDLQPFHEPESSVSGRVGDIDAVEALQVSGVSTDGEEEETETLKDVELDVQRDTGSEFIMDGRGGEGEANVMDYDAAMFQVTSVLHVPFVGEVAEIVRDLIGLFRQMKQNKERAYSIASKCLEIIVLLNEKASWIKISELSRFAGDLIGAFVTVQGIVMGWSNYSRVKAFLNQSKIKEGLNQCEIFLEPASDIVQIKIDRLRDHAYRMNEFRDREEIFEEAGLLIRPDTESTSAVSKGKKAVSGPEPSTNQGPENHPYHQEGQFYPQQQVELARIPKIMNGEVTCDASKPVSKGRHSELWMGLWLGRISVALKELKYDKELSVSIRVRKRLEKEASAWSKLEHKNVLPFYGIVTDLGSQARLVVPWQENGNVLEYAKAHPQANKLALLSDAADGLGYLHSKSILHGHVKCVNILVTSTGQACICDFGMSSLAQEIAPREGLHPDSPRWTSSEKMLTGQRPTMESDVHSFAMSILELITGNPPYANLDSEAEVMDMIISQTAPARPQDESSMDLLSDELWEVMLQCWKDSPSRPRIGVVGALLTKLGRLEEEKIRATYVVDIAEITERQEEGNVEDVGVQFTSDIGPPPPTSDPRVDF